VAGGVFLKKGKMASDASTQAWVTLATNDSYALGALVLASSLRRSGTTRKIVIMTSDHLSEPMKRQLSNVFDEVVNVNILDSKDKINLALLERPELGITFTKLRCWNLVQYSKCVFLDADTMMMKNSDELFERSEFSASPDAGWPDCFNSGVFVFTPSNETFEKLMTHAATEGSFDGGDQGLLNTFFGTWATEDISKHLPFIYNMCATATYSYLPAFKRFSHNIKIIHFIGTSKPWHVKFDQQGSPQSPLHEQHSLEFLKHWWHIFDTDIKPSLTKMGDEIKPTSQGTSGNVSGAMRSEEQPRFEASGGHSSRSQWEEGNPDYMRADSFDNILKKIDSSMTSSDKGSNK